MSTPGLPRALLVAGGVLVAVLAGIGTAGSFGSGGTLWGDQYDPDASDESAKEETVIRAPAIRGTIDSINDVLTEALVSADYESVLDFFAEDAVYFPAMGPPVRGKQALRDHLNDVTPEITDVTFKFREVTVLSPEWATEHGTAVFDFEQEGPGSATEFSYAVLFHETESGWKIKRDIGSATQPPSGSPRPESEGGG